MARRFSSDQGIRDQDTPIDAGPHPSKVIAGAEAEDLAALEGLIRGSWAPDATCALCRLGIPDLLSTRPHDAQSAEQLAKQASCNAHCLKRLLRLCTGYGLLLQTESGKFYLTAKGDMLKADHPSQMKWLAMMLGLPGHHRSRGFLYDNVKTGNMGFQMAFGQDWYSYTESNPEEGTAFEKTMTAISANCARAVAAEYDFSRHKVVVDVGGGQGLMVHAILERHPSLQGFVLELPNVVERARHFTQHSPVHFVEGDMFKPLPIKADCFILRRVVHDFHDAEAAQVLGSVRSALQPGGRVLILETVLPEVVRPGEDVASLEFDMGTMVMTPGHERTRAEWSQLLDMAGLRMCDVVFGPNIPIIIAEA